MSNKVNSQNIQNLPEDQRLAAEKNQRHGHRTGMSCQDIDEPVPFLEIAPCETVHRGKNNCFMILGRDRPSNRSSGFGGQGGTQCGKIDLIAGLASSYPGGVPNDKTIVSPNFGLDAARIYISQKSDIDKHMGNSKVPFDKSKGKSTVAMKSDAMRLFGRNNVKIMTGKGKFSGRHDEKNSLGGEIDGVGGVHLIAGNYTEDESDSSFNLLDPSAVGRGFKQKLQSIVKGSNLIQAIRDIVNLVDQTLQKVDANTTNIQKMNNAIMQHVHPYHGTPPVSYLPSGLIRGAICTLDKTTIKAINKQLEVYPQNHLESTGNNFINSKYNKTT